MNLSLEVLDGQQTTASTPTSPDATVITETPPAFQSRSLKRWILGTVTRKSVNEVVEDINLAPLHFVYPKMEAKFREYLLQNYSGRVLCLSCMGCSFMITMWFAAFFAPDLKWDSYPLLIDSGNQQLRGRSMLQWHFHCLVAVSIVTFVVIATSCYLPTLRKRQETVTHFGLGLHQTLISAIVLLELTSDDPKLALVATAGAQAQKSLVNFETVFWTVIVALFTLCPPVLILDVLLQSRTCQTWIIHLITIAGIIGIMTLVSLQHGDVASKSACALTGFSASLTMLMAYMGRYHRELQERVEHWTFMKNQLRLKVLHHEVARLSPARGEKEVQGESTLEELMALLRHSQRLVAGASSRLLVPDLVRAEEIIKEVLRILSHGGNLFTVRFDNLPEEGESIIDQYIWGGKSFAKSVSNATLERPLSLRSETVPQRRPVLPKQRSVKTRREANDLKKRRDTVNTSMRSPSPMTWQGPMPPSTPTAFTMSNDFSSRDLAMHEMTGNVGQNWDLDVFQFEKKHPNIFVQFGAYLLLPHLSFLDISEDRIFQFLTTVEDCYWENPYHNRIHAATVAHATSCLVKVLELHTGPAYQSLTELVFTVASLGHDVGHPSRNNQFFVNTFDPLAIIYNDISVLENYHAFLTFQILDDDGCDIFQQLFVDCYRDVRRRIIELILATDMKEHFESISKFRIRRAAAGFDMFRDNEDLWHTIRILVKVADLSHACVDWTQHLEWSCRIQEEFYQQGDEEQALGYARSYLCDRSAHAAFAKSQRGFLEFVVCPLLTEVREADPSGFISTSCLDRLYANKEIWAQLDLAGTEVKFPEHILTMRTTPDDMILVLPDKSGHALVTYTGSSQSASDSDCNSSTEIMRPAGPIGRRSESRCPQDFFPRLGSHSRSIIGRPPDLSAEDGRRTSRRPTQSSSQLHKTSGDAYNLTKDLDYRQSSSRGHRRSSNEDRRRRNVRWQRSNNDDSEPA